MTDTITDEMVENFAVIAPWDDMADRLVDRYSSTAERIVMYLAKEMIDRDPSNLDRWGEISRAVVATG